MNRPVNQDDHARWLKQRQDQSDHAMNADEVDAANAAESKKDRTEIVMRAVRRIRKTSKFHYFSPGGVVGPVRGGKRKDEEAIVPQVRAKTPAQYEALCDRILIGLIHAMISDHGDNEWREAIASLLESVHRDHVLGGGTIADSPQPTPTAGPPRKRLVRRAQ